VRRLIALPVLVSILAGCGGGGGSTPSPKPAATSAQMQSGTLGLTFGTQTGTSSSARKPLFVSSNATKANVSINNGAATTFDVSAASPICQTTSNVRTCALPVTAPVGLVSIAVSLMGTVAGNLVMLGQGSSSVTVVSGTNFSLTVGVNPAVAGTTSIAFSTGATVSLTYGTAATVTATVVFADPANTPITGSGNVPNFLVPITLTSSDPHVTLSPTSLTTPGQTFTITYDGSQAVASSVTLSVKAGAAQLASAINQLPGLTVTRINLAPVGVTTVSPEQIVVGPDNNIWFTARTTNDVCRVTPGPNTVQCFPTGFGVGTATGIAAGGDGKIWYSNGAQLIARMNTDGTAPATGPTAGTPLSAGAPGSQVGRLATDSQGNVWYLNGGIGFSQVAYVDKTTFSPFTFGSTPNANSVQAFGGLTLGGDNAMWFTEAKFAPATMKIGRITTPANGAAGTYSETTIAGSGALNFPTDITKDASGDVWFSEFDNSPGQLNQFYANFLPGPGAVAINEFPNVINPAAFGNLVTIFNGPDNNIWLAEGGGAVKIVPAAPNAALTQFFTDNAQNTVVDCISGPTPDGKIWCTALGSGPNPPFNPTNDSILTWTPR
jgi:streptogramin lyase